MNRGRERKKINVDLAADAVLRKSASFVSVSASFGVALQTRHQRCVGVFGLNGIAWPKLWAHEISAIKQVCCLLAKALIAQRSAANAWDQSIHTI